MSKGTLPIHETKIKDKNTFFPYTNDGNRFILDYL